MPGRSFNGSVSTVSATGMPSVGLASHTIIAMVRPASAGEGGFGRIFQAGPPGDFANILYVASSGGFIRINYLARRATAQTDFQASNRGMVTSAREYAFVAASFDDAATPKVRLYSSANEVSNMTELLECSYAATIAGSGAAPTASTQWTIGNDADNNRTWDGDILYAGVVDRVLVLNELQFLTSGGHPFGLGLGVNSRVAHFGLSNTLVTPLEGPGASWTASNTDPSEIAGPNGGAWFNAAGGAVLL